MDIRKDLIDGKIKIEPIYDAQGNLVAGNFASSAANITTGMTLSAASILKMKRLAKKAKVQEILKKLGAGAAKAPPPEVTLDQIPVQPAEKKAMALYRNMIDGFADLPLAIESRFELA